MREGASLKRDICQDYDFQQEKSVSRSIEIICLTFRDRASSI